MRTIINDFTGKRLGRLVVLQDLPKKDKFNYRFWLCQCDCGKTIEFTTKQLNRHKAKGKFVKSCGCLEKENQAISAKRVQQLNTKLPGEAAKKRVFNRYIAQAKYRKLLFDITFEKFLAITAQSCFYCGTENSNIERHKDKIRNGSFIYNGIDRIDNSKGYTVDNIVPCCKICNRAKSSMPYNEFITWLDRIVEFRKK